MNESSTERILQLNTYLGEKDSINIQNRSIAFNNPYKYIDKGGNRAAHSPKEGGYYKPANTSKPSSIQACRVESKYVDLGDYAGLSGTYNGKDKNKIDIYGIQYVVKVYPRSSMKPQD